MNPDPPPAASTDGGTHPGEGPTRAGLSEADRAAAFASGRVPVDRAAALRAGSVPVPKKFVMWVIVGFAKVESTP